jgi:hypothetical protein
MKVMDLENFMLGASTGKDKGKETKSKALAAAKAVKKGAFKKERKKRKSVIFHRPKTLKRPRNPKFPRIRCVLRLLMPYGKH